ncbi:hypothetical protein A2U01_0096117, partial [Trifolium medium]|nr:hypothetical protein [Trifolium medium]
MPNFKAPGANFTVRHQPPRSLFQGDIP